MKKIISTLLGTLVVTLLMTSCSKKDEIFDNLDAKKLTSFMKETTVGVYDGYEKVYILNHQTSQVTFTDDLKLYFMTNADQSEFVKIVLSDTPTLESILTAEVTAVGEGITCPSGTYRVRVVKTQGDTRWLWDEEKLIGFLISF